MNAALYNGAIGALLLGRVDWEQSRLKVLLATDEYEPSQDEHEFRSDLGLCEVPASGSYELGGLDLKERSVEHTGVFGTTRLLAKRSVRWTGFTGDFRWAVVYNARGVRSEDELIAFSDLGSQRVTNATVELQFDREMGVCEFTVERAA